MLGYDVEQYLRAYYIFNICAVLALKADICKDSCSGVLCVIQESPNLGVMSSGQDWHVLHDLPTCIVYTP